MTDTYPSNRVLDLCRELDGLATRLAAQNGSFPYDIGLAVRCLPEQIGRRTFRRFDTADHCLTLDVTVSQDVYRMLSMNEQREQLGSTLYAYIEESVGKYKKKAEEAAIAGLLSSIRDWMREHKWLDGPVAEANALLDEEAPFQDIARKTGLSLTEVEDLWCRRNGVASASLHPDNEKH